MLPKDSFKVLKIFVIAALLFTVAAFSLQEVSAVEKDTNIKSENVKTAADNIVSLKLQSDTTVSDWFYIAFKRYEALAKGESAAYFENLQTAQGAALNPVETQRKAIAGILQGDDGMGTEDVVGVINDTTDKLGIMGYIYGRILINSLNPDDDGFSDLKFTKEGTAAEIVGLQKSDGGWALSGAVSDPDVTAMAIQALSFDYETDAAIKESVDKALALLAARQEETGDYKSWGTRNCETTAQVIMAIYSVGLEYSDERFIKGGNTLIDGIMRYKTENGSFKHALENEISSERATEQAMCAFVAVLRREAVLPGFWQLEATDEINRRVENKGAATVDDPKGIDNKLVISAGIIVMSIIFAFYYFVRNRRKNIVITLVVTLVALAAVFFINIQTVDEYYLVHIDDITADSETVFISISKETVTEGNGGIVLDKREYVLREGDSVFDILERTVRHNRIQMDYSGTPNGIGGSVYIKGLNNLYEFKYGSLSGWIYRVNGKAVSLSCSEYFPEDGDYIQWQYVTELVEME